MITRFAPSPTGPLHLGHAHSAWTAHDMARAAGGTFLLRIEDIDRQRSKPEWEDALHRDLAWLGIGWDASPLRQSERMDAYDDALDILWKRQLLYPCTCTRRDIAEALSAPQEGATMGPDGPVYPGTCRAEAILAHPATRPRDAHLRLNMVSAFRHLEASGQSESSLAFQEVGPLRSGEIQSERATYIDRVGDIVLARRDFGTSYHLSVVLDDAAQGVTHVVRGADLFDATPIHVLLQQLLDLPTPIYHHHDLVRDAAGKRLAKRDDARSIASYRDAGWTAAQLRAHLDRSLVAP
ncbi:tRNA glutamyl-Q(34) synthetase GluQRS [Jannaschia sp.]|nr:tRNA glutamyl-Q(34) synthetase GluQRS [Jannaschia sp.]